MAPIRTAIIGLSASAATSWAGNAHLPYLLSTRGRSKYEIVALLNSSVQAAQRAIKHFSLPQETKAYGDPQSLADDKDVELVVVATRVDVHYETALPSVKAGKSVYVEWPLAQDSSHAEELTTAAKKAGGFGFVGLQGRLAPPVVKLRELLHEGRIGKVLSSEVWSTGGTNDRDLLPVGLKYFTDKAVGVNIVTIGFGHLFDQVQHVLGDIDNIKSQVQIQRPNAKIRDLATNKIVEVVTSNVPDIVFATGTLSKSEISNDGASVHLRFRRGQPIPGDPALVWTINGDKGEIRLKAQSGTALHASAYSGPVTIEVYDFETNKVEQVPWKWEQWQEELPISARSVGVVYEKFAEGDIKSTASFESATRRHQQINDILEG